MTASEFAADTLGEVFVDLAEDVASRFEVEPQVAVLLR